MDRIKAFTLIELLVVISIIALLLAILMPTLNIARQQATGAACLTNQRSLLTAWLMYAYDNDDRMVNGNVHGSSRGIYWVEAPMAEDGTDTSENNPIPLEDKLRGIRRGLLYKYVNSVDVYHCPGDRREIGVSRHAFRSYSILGGMNGVPADGRYGGIIPYQKVSEVKRPVSKMVFLEESDDRGWNRGSWILSISGSYLGWSDPVAIWHNRKSTLGFADGHAEMHDWLDERTVYFAKTGNKDNLDPSPNEDLDYLFKHYPYQALSN